MKVYAIIALVMCVAAVSAQQLSLTQILCPTAIANAQKLVDGAQNALQKQIYQQLLEKVQAQCAQRGVFDSLANVLGLSGVWDTISAIPSALFGQFTDVMEKIIFSGKFLWDSHIKDMLSELVDQLKAHAMDAVPIIASYIPKLLNVLAQSGKREIPAALQRGIWDTISDMFGLSAIWANITTVAADMKSKMIMVLTTISLMGKQAFAQAMEIITQLGKDLVGHSQDAAPLFSAALDKLTAIAAGSIGKREIALERGIFDTIGSFFGLGNVWSTITSLSSDLFGKFMLTLEKLMFAGTTAWNQAKPIFSQLKDDLISHTSNAAPLVSNAITQLTGILASGKRSLAEERGILEFAENFFGISGIISTVTSLGSSIKKQFLDLVAAVFMHGSNAWAAAKPIFSQLVTDLKEHGTNALPFVTGAIAQLQQVVAGTIGKREVVLARGFTDFLMQSFGLGAIIENVQSLTADLKNKFFLTLEKVLFAGKDIAAQAKTILINLVQQLKGHGELAKPLITAAISEITALLSKPKREIALERGIWDTIYSVLGIEGIINTVTALGTSIKDKFLDTVKAVFFAGTAAWTASIPIFTQLKDDIFAHATNAGPYVNQAIDALKAMLVQVAAQHVGKRGLFDSIVDQWNTALASVSTIFNAIKGDLKEKFAAALVTVTLMAGTAKAQAVEIINKLIADIKAHADQAVPLVTAALAQLAALNPLANGKRFIDLQQIKDIISEVAQIVSHIQANLGKQLADLLAKILASKDQIKEQAFAFIQSAFDKLQTSNWGANVTTIVQNLVGQLQGLLGSIGKRGIFDSITGIFSGITSSVMSILNTVTGQAKEQLAAAMLTASTLVGAAKDQAQIIIAQLASDLKDHAGNATPFINNALAQLGALLPGGKRATGGDIIEALVGVFNNSLIGEIVSILSHVSGKVKDALKDLLPVIAFAKPLIKDTVTKLIDQAFNLLQSTNWANAESVIQTLVNKIKDLVA